MLFTNPAASGRPKKLFDTSRLGVPFHPDAADLPLRGLAGYAVQSHRSIETHLADAIPGEEVIGASEVFAQNHSRRAFVITGCIDAQQGNLESLIEIGRAACRE